MSFDYLKIKYPPTIISFSDAMRLLKMARDAFNGDDVEGGDCFYACQEIAKAFEQPLPDPPIGQ